MADPPSPLTDRALLVGAAEVDSLRTAGGELIGFHNVRKGWAVRAASTGGTHFVPVQRLASTMETNCYAWTTFATCVSSERLGRWSRVAVFRVPPAHWHLLPPALIPTEDSLAPAVVASAVRRDCSVHGALGVTKCDSDWSIALNHGALEAVAPPPNPYPAPTADETLEEQRGAPPATEI